MQVRISGAWLITKKSKIITSECTLRCTSAKRLTNVKVDFGISAFERCVFPARLHYVKQKHVPWLSSGTITVIRSGQHFYQSRLRGWWADLLNTRSSLPIRSRSRPLSLSCLPPMYLPRKMENTSSVKKLRLQISTWKLIFYFRRFRLNWLGLICVNQSVSQNHGARGSKRREGIKAGSLNWAEREGKLTRVALMLSKVHKSPICQKIWSVFRTFPCFSSFRVEKQLVENGFRPRHPILFLLLKPLYIRCVVEIHDTVVVDLPVLLRCRRDFSDFDGLWLEFSIFVSHFWKNDPLIFNLLRLFL